MNSVNNMDNAKISEMVLLKRFLILNVLPITDKKVNSQRMPRKKAPPITTTLPRHIQEMHDNIIN